MRILLSLVVMLAAAQPALAETPLEKKHNRWHKATLVVKVITCVLAGPVVLPWLAMEWHDKNLEADVAAESYMNEVLRKLRARQQQPSHAEGVVEQ